MQMLGSILLQPQMLARMQGRNAAEDLVDELIALGQLLAMNPQALAAVAPAFESAAAAFGQTLLTRVEAKLPQALAELRELADPVVTSLTGFADGEAPASAPDLLARIADGLTGLATLAGLLSDEQIRVTVRRVTAILTGTLGLSQAGFRDDFIAMLAAARQSLRQGTAAMTNETAAVRESLACLIARLETDVYPRFPTLDLNPDRLAELLIGVLRGTPLSAALGKAECLLDKIKAVLLAVADITRTAAAATAAAPKAAPRALPAARANRAARSRRAAPRDAGGVPGRDADEHYLWYASWLYATRHQGFENGAGTGLAQSIVPGYPGDEIWQTADKKQLIYRRAGADDRILHGADAPFEWYQAPQFAGPASAEFFSFGSISPQFLETWTQVTSVLAKIAVGMWHVVAMGMSPKEYACNIPLWLWNWTDGIGRAAGGAPLPSLISKAAGWGVGSTWLFSALVPMLIIVGGSFEGVHTKTTTGLGFLQWLTLIGGDAISAFTINAVPNGVRDFSIALFTLINQTGAGTPPSGEDNRPKNWDMADPVIGLVNLLIGMGFQALIPKDDYGLPFDSNGSPSFGPMYFPWWLLAAPLVNAFGNMLGTFVAWAVARTATPAQLGTKVGLGALVGTLTFVVEFYNSKEGGTGDGKYNPKIDPDGKPYPGTPRSDFAGYPPKGSSPYRLPYAKDVAMYVGQANLGFFSHARYNTLPQVYAYDFAHDFQDEILAVRDGTVVDFFDWLPDNINPNSTQAGTARTASDGVMGGAGWRGDNPTWNFITIRHDTANGDHDKDQGGAATVTYATYGHGATNGVRNLWQSLYGKGPGQIIGSRVKQGNPVMQAGSTGVSFHNHLHLHIQGGPAVPATPEAIGSTQLVAPGALTQYTLPFVFGEVSGDGVLQHLTWYKSNNPRSTTLPP
jgi:hypothetical protein